MPAALQSGKCFQFAIYVQAILVAILTSFYDAGAVAPIDPGQKQPSLGPQIASNVRATHGGRDFSHLASKSADAADIKFRSSRVDVQVGDHRKDSVALIRREAVPSTLVKAALVDKSGAVQGRSRPPEPPDLSRQVTENVFIRRGGPEVQLGRNLNSAGASSGSNPGATNSITSSGSNPGATNSITSSGSNPGAIKINYVEAGNHTPLSKTHSSDAVTNSTANAPVHYDSVTHATNNSTNSTTLSKPSSESTSSGAQGALESLKKAEQIEDQLVDEVQDKVAQGSTSSATTTIGPVQIQTPFKIPAVAIGADHELTMWTGTKKGIKRDEEDPEQKKLREGLDKLNVVHKEIKNIMAAQRDLQRNTLEGIIDRAYLENPEKFDAAAAKISSDWQAEEDRHLPETSSGKKFEASLNKIANEANNPSFEKFAD